MNVRHASRVTERLDTDATYAAGYSEAVVTAFRKRMQLIRSATTEQDLRNLKSLHYEKLEGKRKGQRSMRLNDQFRLILKIEDTPNGPQVVVIEITDYH